MREIIFRGKSNGKWVYGSLKQDLKNNKAFILDGKKEVEVDADTVGQYTGLVDKNGNGIFEGDIICQKNAKRNDDTVFYPWEKYGVVRFGTYDFQEDYDGYCTEGWFLEPIQTVSIGNRNCFIGAIQSNINQEDIDNPYQPMGIIGNMHDNDIDEMYEKLTHGSINWEHLEVDTLLAVWDDDDYKKHLRYFAKYESGKIYCWDNGRTSLTTEDDYSAWSYVELAEIDKE